MRNLLRRPWTGIKANRTSEVKAAPKLPTLALSCLLVAQLGGIGPALADDFDLPEGESTETLPPPPPPPPSETAAPAEVPPTAAASDTVPPPPANPSELPDIRARTYDVIFVRRSNSGRVYLLSDSKDAAPRVGRMLLLKRDGKKIMGFRILKHYPEKREFAAKKVRVYDEGPGDLEKKASYVAIEKISDLAPLVPTEQDKSDLKELEAPAPEAEAAPLSSEMPPTADPLASADVPPEDPNAAEPSMAPLPETLAYDPELDAGSSPPPNGAVDDDAASEPVVPVADEEEAASSLTVEEVLPIDRNRHWVTAQIGAFRHATIAGGNFYSWGAGARYGFSLARMLFIRQAQAQDSLALELGAFLFKVLNFAVSGSDRDSYTVMPIVPTARYTVWFGPNLGLFAYGGVQYHALIGATASNEEAKAQGINALRTVLPAAGAGLIFRVGPNWEVRGDLGLDMFGFGLMLRF